MIHPRTLKTLPARRLRRARDWATSLGRELGDWAFRQRLVAQVGSRAHVLCLGDSHSDALRDVRVKGVWLHVKSIEGVTVTGLPNPRSKTRSTQLFSGWLKRLKPWHEVLTQLGEVDCGFVIWDRARRHGISVDRQLTETIDAYHNFIEQILGCGVRRLIVLSVPPPTISDDPGQWQQIRNLRGSIDVSQAARTGLTLRFNDKLRQRCEALGAIFLDVTTGTLDESGHVAKCFVRGDQDHHLADAPYSSLLTEKLSALW